MAKGRIVSNEIARDKKVNELSCDTSRLAFTWLITFADCEGRTHGDPAVVRAMLFPRREDISIQDMQGFIEEWHNAGLITWYEANDDLWIEFPNFDRHQPHLRKDRETPSTIPQPPSDSAELLRINSGVTPEQLPVNLTEVKLTESKLIKEEEGEKSAEINVFKSYEQEIGPITPMIADDLKLLEAEHPPNWIVASFKIAANNGKRNLAYSKAILQRWKADGYGSDPPGRKYGGNGSKPVETPAQRLVREERERLAKGLSP